VGEDGVLNINILQGVLTTGSYDLKALWEKNGGRTLMSSTRSNIFGITEAEANLSYETINVVSYVENYGRDGLSAYELAVMRGLSRGLSEVEWLQSFSSGGEGMSAVFDQDMPIGGTMLGSELLNIVEENPTHEFLQFLSEDKKYIRSGTPFQALFKALLYKAVEAEQPENVSHSEGVVNHNIGNLTISNLGNPSVGDEVAFTVIYSSKNPTITESAIEGMEYGYSKNAELTDKLEDDACYSGHTVERSSEMPSIEVTHNGTVLSKGVDGKYKFTALDGNNTIVARTTEHPYSVQFPAISAWPLDSEGNIAKEYVDGVHIAEIIVDTLGGTEITKEASVTAVVPSYVVYDGVYTMLSTNGTPNNEKNADGSAKYFTINLPYGVAPGDPVDALIPLGSNINSVKAYMFDTNEGYKPTTPEWVIEAENETYNGYTYNRYRCTNYDSMPAAQYFITINTN
jgi:opacity protein-like surface antigen